MKTIEFKTSEGKTRYFVADEKGLPIPSVLTYIRFRDRAGYARNTLRAQCYHLCHYFTYLQELGKGYEQVTIDDLAGFLAWLQNRDVLKKVIPLKFTPDHQAQTVNEIIDTVISFYDYHLRHEGMENKLSAQLVKYVQNPGQNSRRFLYGIADNRVSKSNILKLPVPRMRIRTVSKEDAVILLNNCTNLRDYFLLSLLFESGMRIGEALSLWLEDFDAGNLTVTLHDRGELENLAEIKTVNSPRRLDCTQELMNLFMRYICEYHTADVKTNHVFLKLRGEHAGKAMDYVDVDNLFRGLRKKTGIYVTPHMFRHTSLTLLSEAGWEPELLRQRAGHKSIFTTMDTYVHPSDEAVAKAFHNAAANLKMPVLAEEVER